MSSHNRDVVNDAKTLAFFFGEDFSGKIDLGFLNSVLKQFDINPNFPTPGPTSEPFYVAELLHEPVMTHFENILDQSKNSRTIEYYQIVLRNSSGKFMWVWKRM